MKTMSASAFKARCLRVMDEVRRTRRPVLITKRGRPVGKLVPPDEARSDIFDCMAGSTRIVGDIMNPVDKASDWNAMR